MTTFWGPGRVATPKDVRTRTMIHLTEWRNLTTPPHGHVPSVRRLPGAPGSPWRGERRARGQAHAGQRSERRRDDHRGPRRRHGVLADRPRRAVVLDPGRRPGPRG